MFFQEQWEALKIQQINITRNQYNKTKKKSCFADIEGFYVGLGGWNNNINITFVLEYVPE